jgi:hypothetical protein
VSAPAFTPGPWSVLPEEDDKPYVRVRGTRLGERYKIANALGGYRELERSEATANARLISAAPDLYEAAMTAIGLMEPLTGQGEDAIWRPANKAWETLVAATRKARGEQP